MFKLQADEDFVAAKKKTQQQREANARKFALPKAASKIGGLADLVFMSQIMPITAASMDKPTWSLDMVQFGDNGDVLSHWWILRLDAHGISSSFPTNSTTTPSHYAQQ